MSTKTIDPSTLDVLRSAVIDGKTLRLNCGQLDRKAYQAVNDVLARLGGKWKGGKFQAHVFDRDPEEALAEVLGSGEKPARNPLAFFATPDALAERIVDEAEIPGSDDEVFRILEPSAGTGSIVEAIARTRGAGHVIQAIEIDEVRHAGLIDDGIGCLNRDFLAIRPDELRPFDRVLMNPPFTSPADPIAYVAHVRHAFGFLKPGGRLVSVTPAGFTFAIKPRGLVAFRSFVVEAGRWEQLPGGSFDESGTGVNCCLVVIDKID